MPQYVRHNDLYILAHFENNITNEMLPNGVALSSASTNTYSAGRFGTYAALYSVADYTRFYGNGGTTTDVDIDKYKRFHIDFWLYFDSLTNGATTDIFYLWRGLHSSFDSVYMRCVGGVGSAGLMTLYLKNTNGDSYSSGTVSVYIGNYIHIAIERDSDTAVKVYKNGALDETVNVSGSYKFSDETTELKFGKVHSNTEIFRIDELRVCTGSKYSGNFTPPTQAYTV